MLNYSAEKSKKEKTPSTLLSLLLFYVFADEKLPINTHKTAIINTASNKHTIIIKSTYYKLTIHPRKETTVSFLTACHPPLKHRTLRIQSVRFPSDCDGIKLSRRNIILR